MSTDPLFDALRAYANDNVVKFWAGGFSKTRWSYDVQNAAKRLNAELGTGHSDSECKMKGVSVADYTWRRMPVRSRVTKKGKVIVF